MPYKPTGQPAGRPRKDGQPPQPAKPKTTRQPTLKVVPGEEKPFLEAPCCLTCHPDGWPKGWTGYGCEHGIWARRMVVA